MIEPRVDKGVVKIVKPPTPKPFEQVEQLLYLLPNYDHDKPNKLVPMYHSPAKVDRAHTPDKDKNPGKWQFYDFDLDTVRE